MKKILQLLLFFTSTFVTYSQNVGIGTTTPLAKLHISFGASGNIAPFSPLIVEGNNNTYINLLTPDINESGLLFGKADNSASGGIIYNNIGTPNGFQFRTNGNLTRTVITNSGYWGVGTSDPAYQMDILNRIRIRSGGDNSVSAGLWLNNNANTEVSFIGMEDDTHVGFYGLQAGWRFGMNTQTGALKINGTEGIAGQVIKSNGAGQSAEWISPTKSIYDKTVMMIGSTEIVVPINYPSSADIPGLTHTFTLIENTKVIINYTVNARPVMCAFCTGSSVLMMIDIVGGGGIVSQLNERISNFEYRNLNAVFLKALPAGTYTIRIRASVLDGPAIEFNIYDSRMVLQMIPE